VKGRLSGLAGDFNGRWVLPLSRPPTTSTASTDSASRCTSAWRFSVESQMVSKIL
jgi:hypothetical protein